MTILRAPDMEFHTLAAGQVLTVAPAPAGSAVVWQYPDTGSNPTSGTSLATGSGTVGPFTGSVRLAVECRSGSVDWTVGWPSSRPAPDLSDAQVAGLQALVSGAGNLPQRFLDAEGQQPTAIARPVISPGNIAVNFVPGLWTVSAGSPTVTQGFTGWDGNGVRSGVIQSRTGQPSMLRAVSVANTTEGIILSTPASTMSNRALRGEFLLWIYIENQPGYGPAGTVTGSINVELATTTSSSNSLYVGFNINQLREGWNCLKFVQRNPAAYLPGSGQTEWHPLGVNCTSIGTGVDTDLVNGLVSRLQITWTNMAGATLYFDSIWTDFSHQAQVVLGNDGGPGLLEFALPIFQSYDWRGYFAFPLDISDNGTANNTFKPSTTWYDNTTLRTLYDAGWDGINHTLTHPSLGLYTADAAIATQMIRSRAWLLEYGFTRGSEFYASPQSSSSRLSDLVIRTLGWKLQRHARKWNVTVTEFGLDNPHHVGAIDMGAGTGNRITSVVGGVNTAGPGWQTASRLIRGLDVIIAYGDTWFPFWHGITTTGDNGGGEDLTGDNLLLTRSAFRLFCEYLRSQELAGRVRVCKGITDFWYGGSV